MAKSTLTKRQKKKLRKQMRSLHIGYVAVSVLFLVLGVSVGAFLAMRATASDCFTLCGDATLTYTAGSDITYSDEGVRCISMGEDLSDKMEISSNLPLSQDGSCDLSALAPGEYYITYKATEGRYEGLCRVRIITVTL